MKVILQYMRMNHCQTKHKSNNMNQSTRKSSDLCSDPQKIRTFYLSMKHMTLMRTYITRQPLIWKRDGVLLPDLLRDLQKIGGLEAAREKPGRFPSTVAPLPSGLSSCTISRTSAALGSWSFKLKTEQHPPTEREREREKDVSRWELSMVFFCVLVFSPPSWVLILVVAW